MKYPLTDKRDKRTEPIRLCLSVPKGGNPSGDSVPPASLAPVPPTSFHRFCPGQHMAMDDESNQILLAIVRRVMLGLPLQEPAPEPPEQEESDER